MMWSRRNRSASSSDGGACRSASRRASGCWVGERPAPSPFSTKPAYGRQVEKPTPKGGEGRSAGGSVDCNLGRETVVRVKVDQEACQGHGLCYFSAPELFKLSDEDGRASVLIDPLSDDLKDAAR